MRAQSSSGRCDSGGATLKQPKSRVVSAREAKRILKTTKHSLDPEVSPLALADAFDLADGSVLVLFEDGKGRLWESKDELRAMLDCSERRAKRGPVSAASDLPQGFVEQVPQLVAQLPKLLKLDAADLDGSKSSLNKVDKALRRMDPGRLVAPDVFAALTAYVGEVIRKATNGRWEMHQASDSEETSEPWVVDPSGFRYAPFHIYKELLEYGTSGSLRAFVEWELESPGLRDDGQKSPPTFFVVQTLFVGQSLEPQDLEPYDGKVVTGAPFSATAVRETTQTLANTKLTLRKTESNLFRDSRGRFRREDIVTSFGQSTSSVVISDPVAGTSVVLYPHQKTAQLRKSFDRMLQVRRTRGPDQLKEEDLGTQTIAGVAVQGKRTTSTGGVRQNPITKVYEVSITYVYEVWYSNDLQTIVMGTIQSSGHDDWETRDTYKITNIQRTEPDASLFTMPTGYKVRGKRLLPLPHARE